MGQTSGAPFFSSHCRFVRYDERGGMSEWQGGGLSIDRWTFFDTLGEWSRAQAVVFARDHGFRQEVG